MYQFQNWKRFFDFEKIGHKFKITKIFDSPKPLIENRGKSEGSRNNNMAYGHYLDSLLIDHLKNQIGGGECNIISTTKELALVVGLINANYAPAIKNRDKYYEKMASVLNDSINRTAGDDIFYIVSSKLKTLIRSSLNRISKQGFIAYEETYVLKTRTDQKVRAAEFDELNIIKAIDREVLKKMGISKNEINKSQDCLNEYYDKLFEGIIKKLPYVEYYFTGYDILIISEIRSYNNESRDRKSLNELFINKILNYFKGKKIKVEEGEEYQYFGQPSRKLPKYIRDILNSNYLIQAEFLINELCSLNKKWNNINDTF